MTPPRLIDVYGLTGAIQAALPLTFSEAKMLTWLVRLPLVRRAEIRRFDKAAGWIDGGVLRRKLAPFGIKFITRHGVGYELELSSRAKILAMVEREFAATLAGDSPIVYPAKHEATS